MFSMCQLLIDSSLNCLPLVCLLVRNWFWRKDKRKSLLNLISYFEFRDKFGKSSHQNISRPVFTLAWERTWQLCHIVKLSCSLLEICIKRRDNRNTIYIFDFKTFCLSFYVNPAFDWMLYLKQLYFSVLLHKLGGWLKQGILSDFKIQFLCVKPFPQKTLWRCERTITRPSKSRFFDVFHPVSHT